MEISRDGRLTGSRTRARAWRRPLCLEPRMRFAALRQAEGATGATQGGGKGGVGMAAADDMRRIVRRASWRPQAVLHRLWARMRASGGTDGGLMARLGGGVAGEVVASRCR